MSTTSHPGQLDLDGLFKESARSDREQQVYSNLVLAAAGDDLLDQAGSSLPDSDSFSIILKRVVLTMTPILLADSLGICCAALVARWLVERLLHTTLPIVALVALLPVFLAFWLEGLYTQIWVHPAIEVRQLTHAITIVFLAIAGGAAVTFSAPAAAWCGLAWPVAVVLVPLLRNVARRLGANRDWWGFPTLVIGTGAGADSVARALLRDNNSGLRPILMTDPNGVCRHSVVPVINDHATLESHVRNKTIRHAVIALPELTNANLGRTLDKYGKLLPHILVLSDNSTLPTLWSTSRGCGRLSGIELRNGLLLQTLQLVKRFLDLIIASTALFLGMPILLLTAILVRRSSPGSIFFGHSRIGRHGKRFKAWKFRTMYSNGNEILKKHLAENPEAQAEWERDQKLKNDPRVTPFGRVARKFSLDELPQLWNVLIGDMSVVGPRPIVDGEVWRYGDTFRQYTAVKPGITGMWQVSGRNDIGYDERVLLDQFYIRHWSPWLDIYILAKTVVALMNRDGAY